MGISRSTFSGVAKTRTTLFLGLYWGPLNEGNFKLRFGV